MKGLGDSNDVVIEATHNHVKALAGELDVSLKRMYELLGKDSPYPKLWRILRALGQLNPEGLRIIQADFNARCEEILSKQTRQVTTSSEIHRELSEAIQARLAQLSPAEERREITEAIAVLQRRLAELNVLSLSDRVATGTCR